MPADVPRSPFPNYYANRDSKTTAPEPSAGNAQTPGARAVWERGAPLPLCRSGPASWSARRGRRAGAGRAFAAHVARVVVQARAACAPARGAARSAGRRKLGGRLARPGPRHHGRPTHRIPPGAPRAGSRGLEPVAVGLRAPRPGQDQAGCLHRRHVREDPATRRMLLAAATSRRWLLLLLSGCPGVRAPCYSSAAARCAASTAVYRP